MCSLLRLDDRALNGVKGSKSSMISMVVKESTIFFGSCAAPVFIRIRGSKTTKVKGSAGSQSPDMQALLINARHTGCRETRQQRLCVKSALCALIGLVQRC